MKPLPGFEEKNEFYNLLFPVRLHKLTYPPQVETLFYPHWHREFEVLFLTRGQAILTAEDREFPLRAGEAVFIRPNTLHSARNLSEEPCGFMAVVFHDVMICDLADGDAYQKYVAPILDGSRVFSDTLSPAIPWQAEALAHLASLDKLPVALLRENELFIKSRLLDIWHLCYMHSREQAPESAKTRRSDQLRPVIEYIHSHYMEDLDLNVLADLVPLSVGQFCRIFRDQMRLTPVAYINRHRILQSCRLLGETDMTVTEVANHTGFNTISYFNKVFHAMIGCTPTAYRQEERVAALGHISYS
ncbi:AraC family transcriptional regulator [Ruminococcaceae bacterium OttesenSCG-928-L11]|nr:AraC family transcriptional regulator [Ruminococcaceae bacterium OttesenSCG-928-L11]